MRFMCDAAAPHFSINVRTFLNDKYLECWGGLIAWPTRSFDLNPLDFYLWGHLKGIVYAAAVNDIVKLQQSLEDGCMLIHNS